MKMKQNSTCLILGANGFIGSHIVDQLIQKGNKVRAFDRYLYPGLNFNENENATIIKGDVTDEETLNKAMEGVDYLFHCFSATTPSSSDSEPYLDITDNLLQSVKIFEMAVAKKIKKVIFISTSGAVYGSRAEEGEVREDDKPEPVSPYGICKLTIEHYLNYYKRRHNLDYIIYRLSNPYGPRQPVKHNHGVIPSFIKSISEDKKLIVYGDGSMSRDFIYIEDAVRMMVETFSRNTKHTVYNIGSGEQISLNNIISTLRDLTHKEVKVEHKPSPKTFLQKTPISIGRYEDEFGEVFPTSLKDGLSKTLEGFKLN